VRINQFNYYSVLNKVKVLKLKEGKAFTLPKKKKKTKRRRENELNTKP
jgi:hypothetical protein